jgi:hypothetical protein
MSVTMIFFLPNFVISLSQKPTGRFEVANFSPARYPKDDSSGMVGQLDPGVPSVWETPFQWTSIRATGVGFEGE